MNSKYRKLIPNSITFLSLTCGIVSILLATNSNFVPAGLLILVSFVLDLFDGYAARVLKAGSEFGLQLDSLVDMVSLTVAPTVLAFMYTKAVGIPLILVWPACVSLTLAGAFRLARFNMLPPKESVQQDSIGLTTTSSGAAVALAVLSGLAFPLAKLPVILIIPYLFAISILMVSEVGFPSFFWVFSDRKRTIVLIALFAISTVQFAVFSAWFFWNNVYLGFSLVRAGYKSRQ